MGEYARKRGEELCKLGTADDWRYVRRSEATRFARGCDNSAEIRAMMQDPQILYRFPFPNEDATEHDLSAINQRDMTAGAFALYVPLGVLCRVEHGHICHSMQAPMGGHQLNVFHPCPFDGDRMEKALESGVLSTSPMSRPFAVIAGERYDANGNARTIFECGYCRAPFSLPADELAEVQRMQGQHNGFASLLARLTARGTEGAPPTPAKVEPDSETIAAMAPKISCAACTLASVDMTHTDEHAESCPKRTEGKPTPAPEAPKRRGFVRPGQK